MSTPLHYFNYQKGVLSTGGCSLTKIAEEVGTPAYVYSAEAFLTPLQEFRQGLQGVDHLICFAVKSNSNLAILKLLGDAGAGMDIVSGGELYRARQAGISDDKIVFSGIGKTAKEMASALQGKTGSIYSFNIESIPELHTLNRVALSLKKKARVALRFNPDVNPKTHPYISTGLKENKFGLHKSEILKIVHTLKELPAIELRGISVHIGSQLLSLSPLKDSFQKLKALLLEIEPHLIIPLEFIDLGGGVGVCYKNERAPSVQKYCDLVQSFFGKTSKQQKPLRILLEPGRVIAANSGILLTEVIYRKERPRKDFLVVDAAMNDLMRPALYGSFHDIVPLQETKRKGKKGQLAELRKTDLVGPVCESADCFGKNRLLPRSLQAGDRLAILSAGAYGFTMSSNYNSRPRPPEILVENGKYRVIREREQFEDLTARESFLTRS
ncbi:MAG: diaminopimelate decarboxylase [Bdellovibrionia bacterium]